MKVLVVYGDPRIDSFGGVEEHSRNLVKYLSQDRDLKMNVLNYGHGNRTFVENNVNYTMLKRFTNVMLLYLLFLPLDLFRIWKVVKEQKPDLIHFQGTHPLYCVASVFLKRKYPTLITVHGILAVEMDFLSKNYLSQYFSKVIENYSLKRLDNAIVVAPQIEDIIKTMTNSETLMIPNGIDFETIKLTDPLKNKEKPFLLFMGVLIKRKGVDILLKSLIKVKSEIPNFCLVLAGSGKEEDALKQYVKDNGLKENVKFLGFVKGSLKYSYLKSSEVVILPSLWDSLPISVLEGMGCGKPIIASDVGGIPYLVQDGYNGFLVKPGDADDLADKIITLLKDNDLRVRMGKNSELKAKSFDWSIITQKTIETYKKAIQGD